jgi:hypothetical protein
MPNPATPLKSKPAGAAETPVPNAPGAGLLLTEERLRLFWAKYRGAVTVACVAVSLGIIGNYFWNYYQQQQEAAVQRAYTAAASVDQLKIFVRDHPNHALAPVAELRVADDAYVSGRIPEARDDYAAVALALKTGPFGARAQLGLGITQILSGETAEGAATLRHLADDTTQFMAARTEALYQLASLAAGEGRADEVQRCSSQLIQLDPSSPWTERAFTLEAKLAASRPSLKAGSPLGK